MATTADADDAYNDLITYIKEEQQEYDLETGRTVVGVPETELVPRYGNRSEVFSEAYGSEDILVQAVTREKRGKKETVYFYRRDGL